MLSLLKSSLIRILGNNFTTPFFEKPLVHCALRHQFKKIYDARHVIERKDLWDICIGTMGKATSVLMLEFGVWQGESISYFSKNLTHSASCFWGFDSFEGLPEDWKHMQKGTFSTKGTMPVIDDSRVHFVKGWFQNTFAEGVASARGANPTPGAVLVHFDADLYSSTLFLLSRLYDQFEEYHFIFDEFTGDECRALLNFQQSHGCEVEFIAYSGRSGTDFPVEVFGRLKNNRNHYAP